MKDGKKLVRKIYLMWNGWFIEWDLELLFI
jgi:hypothetical protein